MKKAKKLCAALAALTLAVTAIPASLYTAAEVLLEETLEETVADATDPTEPEEQNTEPTESTEPEESASETAHWYTSPAGNKFYIDANGNKVTGWKIIDGKKYYFRPSGVMQTMWAKINGNKYYFGKTGVMRTMWETIGGNKYYFGKTGVMRTMWEKIGGNKYYFGKTGIMRTGWETIGGDKYYFGKSGVMRTNFQVINGKTYYFGLSGKRRTGWETVGGYRYWFGKSGVMRTGLQQIGNNTYYFLSDGTCCWRMNTWKYLYENAVYNYGDEYNSARYQLVYIDSDSIPELVISTGDFHAAGCQVYTVKNNQLYNLGNYANDGYGRFSYVRKQGLILSGFYNMGCGSYTINKMNSTNMSTLHTAERDDNQNPYRKIDGSYVTNSAYEAFFSSYTSRSDFYTISHDDFKYDIDEDPFETIWYQ